MSEIKAGIYRDISIHDYHAGIGLSASNLSELARSPLHYMTSLNYPSKETPSLRLGIAVHCAILEPERFEIEYVEAPLIDRRTKEGKARFSEIEGSGKIVLSSEEYVKVTGMAKAVHNHELASRLFSGGLSEQSIYWCQSVSSLDVATGILCKARPDYMKLLNHGYVIVDLKTTQDASIKGFQKKAYYQWNYHLQAAHYINGFEAVTKEKVLAFIYVAIESEPPYAVSIFKAGNDFIDAGKAKVKELYELYAECMVKNEWPGYSKEIHELRLPKIAGYKGD